MHSGSPTRRPIRARNTKWAAAAAQWLTRIGLRPNQISVLSVLFAAGAAALLVAAGFTSGHPKAACFIAAALCIPFRLLCNLFDGMVAVEGGFQTKSGEIYNEFPDRIADALILVGAGYSSPDHPFMVDLGWGAAVVSVITAYVRTLGAAAGSGQFFIGPMAKQQRMAVVIAGSLANGVGILAGWRFDFVQATLIIVILGCVITICRRCVRVVRELETT